MNGLRERYDVIIVGGGHNGLVTAAYLAAGGARTLVLERRRILGGACVTEEVFPGFRFSTLSYISALLRPAVVRDLQLKRRGFELLPCDPAVLVPFEDGRSLALWDDAERTRAEISAFSTRDADAYEEMQEQFARIARFLALLIDRPPPSPSLRRPADAWYVLRLAGRFRGLDRADRDTFIQLMTASVQDFLDERFETDAVKAALGASAAIGLAGGPRTPGTAYVMLHYAVGGGESSWGFVRGGMGTITQAMAEACRERGVELRTGVEIAEIRAQNGRVRGVTLATGDEIDAPVVVSNADPKRTFLSLVDRRQIDPDYLRGIKSFRMTGTCAKVNLALSDLPGFTCRPGAPSDAHTGTTEIACSLENLEDGWDACKHGRIAERPCCEVVFPSVRDGTLAPAGKHVLSASVQYVPYELADGDWDARREELGDRVIDTIATYAPSIRDVILHRQVLTPLDLEREYGLTNGNKYHGDLTLAQMFIMRPVMGWARYRTPIDGLYLCGAGTHPGPGVMGAAGRNAAGEILRDRLWKKR
jgi:phytoene dehydrogenase-like protein